MEIRSDGVVDEALLRFRLVAGLMPKHYIIIPPSLHFRRELITSICIEKRVALYGAVFQ